MLPMVTYGCLVWAKSIQKKTYFEKLKRVQGLALRTILGAQRSTPIAAMEMITNTLPLDLNIELKAVLAGKRLMKQGCWRKRSGEPGNTTAGWIEDLIYRQHNHLVMPTDKGTLRRIKPLYETHIKHRDDDGHNVVTDDDPAVINCFTDGSKNKEGHTGAAAFITNKNFQHHEKIYLGKLTSVFQAELVGIQLVIDFLRKRNTQGSKIVVNIDNQAAIKALGGFVSNNSFVNKLKHQLNSIADLNLVILNWLPGHMGYRGNEVADRMAKFATTHPPLGCEPYLPVGSRKLETLSKELMASKQNVRWKRLGTCKYTKRVFHELRPRESRWVMKQSRGRLNRLTGFITGHCRLLSHQFKLGNSVTPICRLCEEEEETSWHILGECPTISKQRFMTMGHCFLEGGGAGGQGSEMSLSTLMKFIAWADSHLETM